MKKGYSMIARSIRSFSPHRSKRSLQFGIPPDPPHPSMVNPFNSPALDSSHCTTCLHPAISNGTPTSLKCLHHGVPGSSDTHRGVIDTSDMCPIGPPGYGYGLDALAPSDLNAIYAHGSSVLEDQIPCRVFSENIFPAVSLCHEKACMDNTTDKPQFMKLYDVRERSSRGKGSVEVDISSRPNDGSPSQPIFENPTEGVQALLDSIFRSQLTKNYTSTLFTSWVACPPSGSEGKTVLCYTAGHAFAPNHYGLRYIAEAADFGWEGGTGRFGSLVKHKQLWGGFNIATKPLAIAYNIMDDFACFEASCIDSSQDFLLPCSPDEIKVGGFVASYGYPCVDYFLQQAHRELILKSENHGVEDLYKYLGTDAHSLYKLLQDAFGIFSEGQLLCSPGILTLQGKSLLHIKSSTLIGASGSPIVPTGLPGYTIGVHQGGMEADANVAESTDSPAFVDSYAKYVLPRLPSPRHPAFYCRDLAPFRRWLNKHGLKWYNDAEVEHGFVTPPTKGRR